VHSKTVNQTGGIQKAKSIRDIDWLASLGLPNFLSIVPLVVQTHGLEIIFAIHLATISTVALMWEIVH